MRRSTATVLCLMALGVTLHGLAATVTSTADSGSGSLRDAIASAAAGDTIGFSVTGTITLTSGELLIVKNLTISGPGAASLAVQRSSASGTPLFRIFDVQGGIVSISGLTISNGSDTTGGGGGLNNQATCTVRDCIITGNSASGSGGGVNNLSTLSLSNCVVRGNSVAASASDAQGGGIFSDGTLTVINCTVSGNSALGGSVVSGFGGGINNQGTLTLTNSVISGNAAGGGAGAEGGGIFNGTTLTVDTSTIGSNRAVGGSGSTGSAGEGGGIGNGFGTVTVNRSTVSGNLAEGGAGASGAGGAGTGGGVANDFGTVTLESSTVSGNTAIGGTGATSVGSSQGAGVYNGIGVVTLDHSTITANGSPGVATQQGDGVFNSGGQVAIHDTIVAGNSGPFPAVSDLFNGVTGIILSGILSGGYNLIGATNGAITPGPNDRFNISAAVLEIGPLQDNGGPTLTHALLCGSPAIDSGDNTRAPATDQREFPRIVNGIIDIGAYEYSNTAPTITCSGAITLGCGSAVPTSVTVSANVTDADGDPLAVVWSLDGTAAQTNLVASSGPPTSARVEFTALVGAGAHQITASVSDPSECVAACTIPITSSTNLGPTISCPAPIVLNCASRTGAVATVSVNVGDVDGDSLVVVWTLDGTASQTNQVPAGGPPTSASVDFTAFFAAGTHQVAASVTEPGGCSASCSTTVTVLSNTPPTITCPSPVTLKCAPSAGEVAAVSVNVADGDGDPLVVVWTVDGAVYRTNLVAGSAGGTAASVTLTAPFTVGAHMIGVSVSDPSGCEAACVTMVTVIARGDLYPIALHTNSLVGVQIGGTIPDIYNGSQSGNFGWLTWAGNPSEPTLVRSLRPPGNSRTYVNPANKNDHFVAVGDWVQGKAGISNSQQVRQALNVLKQIDITVPVWDKATGKGNNSLYHVVGFAKVRILDYQLPKENRITAKFLGFTDCR